MFKHDWLVVFKDTTSLSYTIIVNDLDELKEFYAKNKQRIHVGFNNKRYDNLVYRAMLDGANPYAVTHMIIAQDDGYGVYKRWNLNKSPYPSVDMSQDLGMVGLSLKEYEGFKGFNIDESDIPFDIQRPLTEDEIQSTISYCISDVDATHQLLLDKIDVVKSKITIITEFGLSKGDLILTNAQLVAKVMGAKLVERDDEFKPFDFSQLKLKYVLDVMGEMHIKGEQPVRMSVRDFYSREYDYDSKLIVKLFGMEITFAFGGIHGALNNFHHKGEIWLDDVTSFYPNLMYRYKFLSRNVMKGGLDLLKRLISDRVTVKKSDPAKSEAYKLIINIIFGASGAKFNQMYDPHQANNICVGGQLLLMDLALRLEPYTKIVQVNTDGVAHIPINRTMCNFMAREWEQDTGLSLGRDNLKAIHQKDVNNYIVINEDDSLTVKGAYVLQTRVNGHKPRTLKMSGKVIDDAVVNYFVHGISPEVTVGNCEEQLDFQIIKKTGSTFEKTICYIDGKEVKIQKINRVFATTDKSRGTLYKVREDGSKSLVPSLPEHNWVANEGVFDMKHIDRQYYIDEAWKRIKDYI